MCYYQLVALILPSQGIKLTTLDASMNNLTSLSIFSHLVNLEEVDLDNNRFVGSLEPLSNCSKLKKVDISNNNLNSYGLEHLSENIEIINPIIVENVVKEKLNWEEINVLLKKEFQQEKKLTEEKEKKEILEKKFLERKRYWLNKEIDFWKQQDVSFSFSSEKCYNELKKLEKKEEKSLKKK